MSEKAQKNSLQKEHGKQKEGKMEGQFSKQKEIGGRKGPEPVRYGDWEKGGRCIDF